MSQNILKKVTIEPFKEAYRKEDGQIECGVHIRIDQGQGVRDLKCLCTKAYLEALIEEIDCFLEGHVTQENNVFFQNPLFLGSSIKYPYSFREFPQSGNWVFYTHEDSWGLERKEICTFSKADLKFMRIQIAEQIATVDWENLGKLMLYRFRLPEKEIRWFYSTKEIKYMLKTCCVGRCIRNMYRNSLYFVDSTCGLGSIGSDKLLIELDDKLIEVNFPEKGMAGCRVFDRSEVEITAVYDHVHDWYEDFCEISELYDRVYKNRFILDVKVESGRFWGWETEGLDLTKIKNEEKMPCKVLFELDNQVKMSLHGSDEELVLCIYNAENE